MLAKSERVLAAIAGLLFFTLNELRLFNAGAREPDPASGQVYAAFLRVFGSSEQIYLNAFDAASRWALVVLTVGLCVWAVSETLRRAPAKTKS